MTSLIKRKMKNDFEKRLSKKIQEYVEMSCCVFSFHFLHNQLMRQLLFSQYFTLRLFHKGGIQLKQESTDMDRDELRDTVKFIRCSKSITTTINIHSNLRL